MANSKVVSFRFNDAEIQALEALQTEEDDGSLNQTAARLLRSILSTFIVPSTALTVDKLEAMIEERCRKEISEVQARVEALEQRLGEISLEKSPRSTEHDCYT